MHAWKFAVSDYCHHHDHHCLIMIIIVFVITIITIINVFVIVIIILLMRAWKFYVSDYCHHHHCHNMIIITITWSSLFSSSQSSLSSSSFCSCMHENLLCQRWQRLSTAARECSPPAHSSNYSLPDHHDANDHDHYHHDDDDHDDGNYDSCDCGSYSKAGLYSPFTFWTSLKLYQTVWFKVTKRNTILAYIHSNIHATCFCLLPFTQGQVNYIILKIIYVWWLSLFFTAPKSRGIFILEKNQQI